MMTLTAHLSVLVSVARLRSLPPSLRHPACTPTFGCLTPLPPLAPSQPAFVFRSVPGSMYAFFINFIHFVLEALVKLASAIIDCWLYRISVLGLAFHSTTLIERYGTTITIKFTTTPVPGLVPGPVTVSVHVHAPCFACAHRS